MDGGTMNMRLQSGKMGELAAERWFADNQWHMVRTQPPVTILGMITPPMVSVLKRFIPRLAAFGHMVIARMGRGGVPDYMGHTVSASGYPLYRCCEVKEATGDTMPASRLASDQREFMKRLPVGCAFVGIFWLDTMKFSMYEFIEKGSYKRYPM